MRNTPQGFMRPRPARNAPNATETSAGTGGKTFSTAASAPMIAYSGPGGSDSRKAMKSFKERDGDRGDAFATTDPAHAFVGLGFDGYALHGHTERTRQALPHAIDVTRKLGLL